MQKPSRQLLLRDWLPAVAIAIGIGYVAAQDSFGPSDMQALMDAEAAHAEAQRQSVMAANREWAAKQACPGGTPTWEGETTLICKARKGHTQQTLAIAEQ